MPKSDGWKNLLKWKPGQSGNLNGAPRKWTDAKLTELGEALIKFMKKKENWHISAFCIEYGIHEKNLYDLASRYPLLYRYLDDARKIVGHRMYQYGMEKNPNQWMMKTFMPRFLGVEDIVEKSLEKEEFIKAEAKVKAIDQHLESMGDIKEYLESQKVKIEDKQDEKQND